MCLWVRVWMYVRLFIRECLYTYADVVCTLIYLTTKISEHSTLVNLAHLGPGVFVLVD